MGKKYESKLSSIDSKQIEFKKKRRWIGSDEDYLKRKGIMLSDSR